MHRHEFDSVIGSAHDRCGLVDPHVIGRRQVEFALPGRNAEREVLHHPAIFSPANVSLVVVAHPCHVATSRPDGREPPLMPLSLRSARRLVAINMAINSHYKI